MDDEMIEYIIARWETFTAKLGPNQIMDSNSVEVQYPPLHNEPPAVMVPPPPDAAADAQHSVVVPSPPNAAPNAQPAQNQNIQNADVVGWAVTATTTFVFGDNPLLFHAHVVEIMFEHRQRWLDLLGNGGLRLRATILRKNKRSRNERYLGKGWY
ncbi:Mediator of RNA polymerase II transcription subunit [Sesbania bispinosa]|nr:Mediator of RNA polymerase II transcription subunit [Sesbania bispinosa]